MKKAQISSMDFLTAVFIFCLVVAYAMSVINDSSIKSFTETDYKYMTVSAIEITDFLIKSPGIPSSWNSSNVIFAGLASKDRVISSSKVTEFCNLTQNQTRAMLRIPYYVHFSIIGNNTIECGLIPSGKKAVSIRRNVFFEDKNAVLKLTLWE
ncbi:hypothetical protein JXC34_07375 [Candidatus Woesearchaeota archaeon]|nr:hypothetical protein [Candidatus Woesearchaeota archaeon]